MSDKWYKLDNAALIYAPSANSKHSGLFRLAAVMKEKVDPEILQQAVNDILPRFPTMTLRLRKGFFWFYCDENKKPFYVTEDTQYPCSLMKIDSTDFMFRVMYYNNRIAFESFHVLTDGGGGWVFLKTIVRRYLELCGVVVEGYEGCLNYLDKPTDEEVTDAYQLAADMKTFAKRKEPSAYKVNCPISPNHFYITHGQMQVGQLKDAAKRYNCSIGYILTAAIAFAMYKDKARKLSERQRGKKLLRPIVVCVSIDLRRRFVGRNTMRNFTHYINMHLTDNKAHTFETVLKDISDYYDRITPELIMANINSNVRDQNSWIVRIVPLPIKAAVMTMLFSKLGEGLSSCALSNYGVTACPKAFYDHVERLESCLGPSKNPSIDCSIVTFADKTVLTFGTNGTRSSVERDCFMILSELGIDVTVDGNRRIFNE